MNTTTSTAIDAIFFNVQQSEVRSTNNNAINAKPYWENPYTTNELNEWRNAWLLGHWHLLMHTTRMNEWTNKRMNGWNVPITSTQKTIYTVHIPAHRWSTNNKIKNKLFKFIFPYDKCNLFALNTITTLNLSPWKRMLVDCMLCWFDVVG